MKEDLLKEAKQFLSIVETATAKDSEITLLIQAAQNELTRSGINIEYNAITDDDGEISSYDSLVETAIMMFVKANFGNVNIKEKELALRTFNSLQQCLSLSEGYKNE